MQFFKNHSKMVLVSTILDSLYAILLILYIFSSIFYYTRNYSGSRAAIGAIGTMFVTPHLIGIVLGAVFSGVALFTNKIWAATTSCVIVFVSTLLMQIPIPIFFMCSFSLGIIGIVAIVCLNKLNQKADMNKAIQN